MINIEVSNKEYNKYIEFIKNKVYKLLPLREEKSYWEKHLDTVIFELSGFIKIVGAAPEIISITAKLENLRECENFQIYRKTIFECLSSLDSIKREE